MSSSEYLAHLLIILGVSKSKDKVSFFKSIKAHLLCLFLARIRKENYTTL